MSEHDKPGQVRAPHAPIPPRGSGQAPPPTRRAECIASGTVHACPDPTGCAGCDPDAPEPPSAEDVVDVIRGTLLSHLLSFSPSRRHEIAVAVSHDLHAAGYAIVPAPVEPQRGGKREDPYAAMEAATGLRMSEWQRRAYDQIMEGGDPSAPRPRREGLNDKRAAEDAYDVYIDERYPGLSRPVDRAELARWFEPTVCLDPLCDDGWIWVDVTDGGQVVKQRCPFPHAEEMP